MLSRFCFILFYFNFEKEKERNSSWVKLSQERKCKANGGNRVMEKLKQLSLLCSIQIEPLWTEKGWEDSGEKVLRNQPAERCFSISGSSSWLMCGFTSTMSLKANTSKPNICTCPTTAEYSYCTLAALHRELLEDSLERKPPTITKPSFFFRALIVFSH